MPPPHDLQLIMILVCQGDIYNAYGFFIFVEITVDGQLLVLTLLELSK